MNAKIANYRRNDGFLWEKLLRALNARNAGKKPFVFLVLAFKSQIQYLMLE